MLISINPDNPQGRKIQEVVKVLEKGGVIIYPTDTIYGLGCDIQNHKAVERIIRLRGLKKEKANLTFICQDIQQLAFYAHQIDNKVFRLLRRNLPGPFTFILRAGKSLPKLLKNKRKSIGVRIPDNRIAQAIISELGRPILSISLKSEDEIMEYFTDPTEIHDDFHKLVDLVIDGGMGKNVPSTVVDCTSSEPELIRQGIGELEFWNFNSHVVLLTVFLAIRQSLTKL